MSDHEESLVGGQHIPEGLDFLQMIWKHEDDCERRTDREMPKMGEKAPQCFAQLGTVLSHLFKLSACHWGCRGGDHLIEYLAGRAANCARASLRLLRFGFYDESLSVTRNIGEIANLLCLFAYDAASFEKWCNADVKVRRKDFRPVKVREELERLGVPVPIAVDRYSRLCEVGTHVSADTIPGSHNLLNLPVLGGHLQEVGVLVALNELAIAVSMVTFFSALYLEDLDENIRAELRSAAYRLDESIGGATITQITSFWEMVRETPEFVEARQYMKLLQKRLRMTNDPEERRTIAALLQRLV